MEGRWRELNRAMWDEKTPLHLKAPLYDLEGFKTGRLSLKRHEIEDLGDVRDRDLLHLQCHIGLDSLSWARLGARVTGLDFSHASVEAAQNLSREIGVQARFICADVYEALTVLPPQAFDIVYTGVGALCWLPDIKSWARIVHDLLRPGGQLYLFEFHPLEWILDDGSERPGIAFDYFTPPAGFREGASVSYADGSVVAANETIQWNHGLGTVVTAAIDAGLQIDALREMDRAVIRRWPGMEQAGDGLYRMAAGTPSLPLMYVLRASRPAFAQ